MSILLPSILLILIAATSVSGQPAPPTIDMTKLGPQAGERVADFRLQDQDGKVWTRDALMGPNGLGFSKRPIRNEIPSPASC